LAFGVAPLQQRQQLRKAAHKGIRKKKNTIFLIAADEKTDILMLAAIRALCYAFLLNNS
jgi:hypothetical protein